jgi:hypothetical protein
MGVRDIYRDRASLGHIPVLKGQTLIETPYRLQADANTTALWWFDEAYGTYLKDKKGTNHITLTDAPVWGAGSPFLSDLTFAEPDDFGTLTSIIDFTSAFTIEALVKTTVTGGDHAIIHASNTTAAPCYGNGWRMTVGWEDDFGCLFYNGTANQSVQSTVTVNDGAYHYLVGRLGSNVLDVFKDGSNVGTANVSGNVAATTRPPTIACATADTGGNNYARFGGSIAMIRLSAVARPDAEILMNAKLMGFA